MFLVSYMVVAGFLNYITSSKWLKIIIFQFSGHANHKSLQYCTAAQDANSERIHSMANTAFSPNWITWLSHLLLHDTHILLINAL
jgi:hypothetical protein